MSNTPDPVIQHIREQAVKARMTDEQKKWPVVAVLSGSTPVIEVIVRYASTQCGHPMNWGFVGGRAIVQSPGDKNQCRSALRLAIPETDITRQEMY